jgi:hypothetical protein
MVSTAKTPFDPSIHRVQRRSGFAGALPTSEEQYDYGSDSGIGVN